METILIILVVLQLGNFVVLDNIDEKYILKYLSVLYIPFIGYYIYIKEKLYKS